MARARDKVAIGYVHPAEVSALFASSLVKLIAHDIISSHRLIGTPINLFSSANISNARNEVVKQFLNTEADWLLMLDADMVFEHTLIDDLLREASMRDAPIVGGLCFGAEDGHMFPTTYGIATEGDSRRVVWLRYYEQEAMCRVSATGAACIIMHRTVLEKIRDAETARGNAAFPWYQEGTIDGRPCGEDITFCLRAGALGIPIFVDTRVKVGHAKPYILTEETYMKQRKDKERDE